MRKLTSIAVLTALLRAPSLLAAEPQTPPMDKLVAECHRQGFIAAVCNPLPNSDGIGPMLGFAQARLANGNTGLLVLTEASIDFHSNLNDEHLSIFAFAIIGICDDLTTNTGNDATVAYATSAANRNYFRITSRKTTITFWVPGGREDTNNAARFYEHVLGTILPVEHCTLRTP